MIAIDHFIDGEIRPSRARETFADIDPTVREPWAEVALGRTEDADDAVMATRRAFDKGPWPHMSPVERGALLHRLADLIMRDAERLAYLETTDMGKPITQARQNDIPRSADNFRFFADFARLAEAERMPSETHHMYTRYEPTGVVTAISPWNFPLMLATWKIAPALAFGNTVVLKPAEQSPASCALLAELAMEAGLPAGVLNVVHGFGPDGVGEALTRHPAVDLVTFTGESNTGRSILAAVAPTLKRVSFELGGKGANLVFADANLDAAISWSIRAIFTNAGQVCLAGSRLFVERSIFDEFLSRFVDAADAMCIGDPKETHVEIGPLASEEHWQKVSGYLDIAEQEGARLVTGGRSDGWVIRPTVLTEVNPAMRICREEIFGPVVTVQPFESEAEAVALANDTRYGLNAMVFSENFGAPTVWLAHLRAGTVWVNCFFIRDLRLPFGGFGDSGMGREGGRFSREFFTEPKAVVMEI